MNGSASPRPGVLGLWDRLVGPGASSVENAVTLVLAPLAAFGAWWILPAGSAPLQQALAAVLAFDVVAGVWVMSSPAGRRWYGRPERSVLSRWAFGAGHVHPFVVAWAFDASVSWASVLYGSVVFATTSIPVLPGRLRGATAAVWVVVTLSVTAGFESPLPWFGPAYLLKLVVGHLGLRPGCDD